MQQLLVQFDVIHLVNLPPFLDPSKLTSLNLNQIAWWDEKYRKIEVSSANGRKVQLLFRRNKEGALDSNRDYGMKKTTLHMKYTDEVCFCFGIALVEDEGVRLPPFEYTQQKVVLH